MRTSIEWEWVLSLCTLTSSFLHCRVEDIYRHIWAANAHALLHNLPLSSTIVRAENNCFKSYQLQLPLLFFRESTRIIKLLLKRLTI